MAKENYTYFVSIMGKLRDKPGYRAATPERKNHKTTINTWGMTNEPLAYRSLKLLLEELEPLTGPLSYSRVYREVTQQGISASVVPAWSTLSNYYDPMNSAVVLISRQVVETGIKGQR